ncbi:MAG: glycosyltransferase [Burkholderiaceae bacterium]
MSLDSSWAVRQEQAVAASPLASAGDEASAVRTNRIPSGAAGAHTPLISVVMPVYNGAATIVESIQSALDQTLTPIEIIVVDDGSQDDTLARIERFGELVRVLRQDRGGNASARNLGLNEARGDWIAVLDADDIWAPNKLERQIRHCQDADVIYSVTRNFGDCSAVGEITHLTDLRRPDDPLRSLMLDNFITHSSVLVRRDALLAVDGYDAALRTACDWDLWLRLAHAGYRFRGVPEVLVYYRWDQGTTSRRNHGLNTRNRLRVVKRAVVRSGLARIGWSTLREALHGVCRTSAWFAERERPFFALRWYLLAQLFRPTDYATWRAIAALSARTVLSALKPTGKVAGDSTRVGSDAP